MCVKYNFFFSPSGSEKFEKNIKYGSEQVTQSIKEYRTPKNDILGKTVKPVLFNNARSLNTCQSQKLYNVTKVPNPKIQYGKIITKNCHFREYYGLKCAT